MTERQGKRLIALWPVQFCTSVMQTSPNKQYYLNESVIGIVSAVAMKNRTVIALVHQLLLINCGIIVMLNNKYLLSYFTDVIMRKRIHNHVAALR